MLRTRATNLRLLEAQKRERAPLGRSEHLVVGEKATQRLQEERLPLTTLSARKNDHWSSLPPPRGQSVENICAQSRHIDAVGTQGSLHNF